MPLAYTAARPGIATGDCIIVRDVAGLLTPFTKYFTHSDYTHAGVAIWIGEGLYLAELNSGRNHLIPLSQLRGCDFDVFHCPSNAGTHDIRDAIQEALRDKIHYSVPALLVIGLAEWLRLNWSANAQHELVCSGFVVMIYDKLGWPPLSRVISPQKLSENLRLKLQVRAESPS